MKSNKMSEIREKNQSELLKEVMDLKSELFNLIFQHSANQLDNPMKIKEVRKSIARVKTVLRERELNGTL